ncbi:MAG TPA: tetratricopeptide repeat protein [Isosphaeraceae bacterium]|nr:tetratricopeptide repeat protein [Isosphaeraceae bacterium]
MASVDPYSPCPCGSGQKFKWCCQKVESYAERAQRMVDNGQFESALRPLAEGLAKVPDNPWLLLRKALIELHLNQLGPARQSLEALLKKTPGHPGGTILMTRLALETEGPAAGIASFQQGLSAMEPQQRPTLAPLAAFAGISLVRAGFPIAAMKHLELAQQWGGGKDESTTSALQSLRASRDLSAWEKNPYRLWPPPQGVTDAFRESFERAIGWAEEGLWSSAASAFELLAAGSSAGAIADRNRGLCCLWLADHEAAVAALRRFIARTGPSLEAVDLEVLCQRIAANPGEETVELVHLSWPIRNRDGLLAALRAEPACEPGPERPINPDDPDSSKVEHFFLLDRPKIEARAGLTRRDIPVVEGELLVAQDHVVLETYDDGRLDRLIDRFTALARANIPPAHPRTKVIGHESRYHLAMSWRWNFPPGIAEVDVQRLNREQSAYLAREVWPATPNPVLRGRTPLQAAQAGDAETPLRAAVRLLEASVDDPDGLVAWDQLRSRLGLPPEPAVAPESLDLDRLHLSRWPLIPAEALDDDRLLDLYHRAGHWGMRPVLIRAARAIAARPSLRIKGEIPPIALFGALALDAAQRDDRTEAQDWMERGREAEPPSRQASQAVLWDLLALQIAMVLDEPEVWVPILVGVLDRYRGNTDAMSAVLRRLIELGLIRATIDPKRRDQIELDTRILDEYLKRFGPRVATTAADRGGSPIWTPEASRGGSSIWTPGSEAAPRPGEERKIILPGQ